MAIVRTDQWVASGHDDHGWAPIVSRARASCTAEGLREHRSTVLGRRRRERDVPTVFSTDTFETSFRRYALRLDFEIDRRRLRELQAAALR